MLLSNITFLSFVVFVVKCSLFISQYNGLLFWSTLYSGWASKLGGIINLVDRGRSSLSCPDRPAFSSYVNLLSPEFGANFQREVPVYQNRVTKRFKLVSLKTTVGLLFAVDSVQLSIFLKHDGYLIALLIGYLIRLLSAASQSPLKNYRSTAVGNSVTCRRISRINLASVKASTPGSKQYDCWNSCRHY